MNTVARRVISGLIILVGLGILLYPSFSQYWNEKHGSYAMAVYEDAAGGMDAEQIAAMFAAAASYNSRLADGNMSVLEYWSLLNIDGNGMMGYLSIPKINVELPIYHGTEEAVLQVAIGHLQDSSLPVGGESTHAALTGHRGLPTNSLLTDLDQMKIGDQFYVTVLDQTLAYETDQILTVLPTEMSSLAIAPGQDYVTLITCTPYGINSHRLLVRGHRVPYTPEDLTTILDNQAPTSFFQRLPMQYRHMLLGVGTLTVFLLVRQGVMTAMRKRQRRLRYYDI